MRNCSTGDDGDDGDEAGVLFLGSDNGSVGSGSMYGFWTARRELVQGFRGASSI